MQHILYKKRLTIILTKIANYGNISIIKTWLGDNPLRGQYRMYIIYISLTGQRTLIIYGYGIAYKDVSDI